MENTSPQIVVVGSSNTDLVVRVPELPRTGETLLGLDFQIHAGGKGANQAVAARRLGATVTLIANIGVDSFGEASIERFRAEGIRVGAIARDTEAASGVAMIWVSETGQNSIVVALGSNARLTPQHVEDASGVFQNADVLLTQLETPLPTVAFALRTARSIGVRTILNPAPATVLGPELLADVDWITPNETEAARISGIEVQNASDAEHAANALRRMGARNVVVTMGEAGALLMTDDESLHVPARRVQAVDTVAAGDAFNGAFAVALARNATPREAVEFACAAASLSVTRRGAQPALPTADEVTKFASQLA